MASQESLARVQELYVAYYGRPADQEGQEYWADRIDDEGESAIINAFGNSAEYEAMAEGQGNATLVNNLYDQMFGRDADPEGLAYYTGVLESGEKSLAEIATTILNAASGVDQNEFNAKVEAAAEYTADFGSADDYDITAAQDVVENAEGGLYTPELTPAIEDFQDAQQAVSDYLQDTVASNEAVADALEAAGNADDPTDAQVSASLSTALGDAETAVNTAGGITLDSDESVAQAQIAAAQEDLADDVESAEETVAETDGLQGKINSMQTVETRYESALKAEIDTSKALDGEGAKFASVNDETITVSNTPDDGVLAQIGVDDGSGTTTTEDFLTVEDGEVVLDSAFTASDYEGLDALLSSAQEQYDAEQGVIKQEGAFEEAVNAVINADDDIEDADASSGTEYSVDGDGNVTLSLSNGTYTADDTEALLTAQEEAAAFDEAVADYQELTDLDQQYSDLDDAATEAGEAIDDMGVTLTDPSNGVDNGETDNDLFVFDAETYDGQTIGSFGDNGTDQIYIGDSYSAVELDLDSGDTLAGTDQGDANTLEVFFSDDGTNTTLSFENKAFAGNNEDAAGTSFDGAELTLNGVTADQLSFDNGYISVA